MDRYASNAERVSARYTDERTIRRRRVIINDDSTVRADKVVLGWISAACTGRRSLNRKTCVDSWDGEGYLRGPVTGAGRNGDGSSRLVNALESVEYIGWTARIGGSRLRLCAEAPQKQ